jgi:hypothetical protein
MMRITDQYKNIEVLGDNTRSIPAQVFFQMVWWLQKRKLLIGLGYFAPLSTMLLLEEIGVPRENHWSLKTLSHNIVSSISHMI